MGAKPDRERGVLLRSGKAAFDIGLRSALSFLYNFVDSNRYLFAVLLHRVQDVEQIIASVVNILYHTEFVLHAGLYSFMPRDIIVKPGRGHRQPPKRPSLGVEKWNPSARMTEDPSAHRGRGWRRWMLSPSV